jgi:predicted double-glycine peptidase
LSGGTDKTTKSPVRISCVQLESRIEHLLNTSLECFRYTNLLDGVQLMTREYKESENDLQRAVNRLENIANGYNMRISTTKTKTVAFQERKYA